MGLYIYSPLATVRKSRPSVDDPSPATERVCLFRCVGLSRLWGQSVNFRSIESIAASDGNHPDFVSDAKVVSGGVWEKFKKLMNVIEIRLTAQFGQSDEYLTTIAFFRTILFINSYDSFVDDRTEWSCCNVTFEEFIQHSHKDIVGRN